MAFQCSGNLSLTNGYNCDVVVYTVYDNGTDTVERRDDFYQEMAFFVAGKGHIEYSNITAIRIETPEGIMLAEYPSEYLTKLRKVYKKKNKQRESWIFSEKGLFFITDVISKHYKWDKEKIIAYYCSDKAIQDLQILLEK